MKLQIIWVGPGVPLDRVLGCHLPLYAFPKTSHPPSTCPILQSGEEELPRVQTRKALDPQDEGRVAYRGCSAPLPQWNLFIFSTILVLCCYALASTPGRYSNEDLLDLGGSSEELAFSATVEPRQTLDTELRMQQTPDQSPDDSRCAKVKIQQTSNKNVHI